LQSRSDIFMRVLVPVAFAGMLCLLGACSLQNKGATVEQAASPSIEHGKYLVEAVGECADCHTPRLKDGRFDESKSLEGAVLGFAPTVPMPVWAPKSPPIAGGPEGWSRDELVTFLETGRNPQGTFARPPMPPYRLSGDDARAVAEFLLSLKRVDRQP